MARIIKATSAKLNAIFNAVIDEVKEVVPGYETTEFDRHEAFFNRENGVSTIEATHAPLINDENGAYYDEENALEVVVTFTEEGFTACVTIAEGDLAKTFIFNAEKLYIYDVTVAYHDGRKFVGVNGCCNVLDNAHIIKRSVDLARACRG